MAKTQVARNLNGTFGMATGAAFTETVIATGVNPNTGGAMIIDSVDFLLDAVDLAAVASDGIWEWALSRDQKTLTVPGLDDNDVICRFGLAMPLTTSGVGVVPTAFHWEAPPGIVVVEPNLYIHSSGSAALSPSSYRINYSLVELSELEFLRLQAQLAA
jgi:hypothetical protein